MKIAIAQVNTTSGDVQGNLRKILQRTEDARAAGAQLVAFPELAVSGWMPMDLLRERAFVAENEAALARLAEEARGIAVLVGRVGAGTEGRFTSAGSLLTDGNCGEAWGNTCLDSLEVWSRTTGDGRPAQIRWEEIDGQRVACAVGGPQVGPAPPAVAGEVRVLTHICAMPFHRGCRAEREKHWGDLARRLGLPVVWINLVGGNGTTVFDGGSLVMDAEGRKVAEARLFGDDLLVVDLGSMPEPAAPVPTGDTAQVYEALKLGLGDYVRKCGFRDVVLGLSGGIDSALVAAIAADALSPEHVTALGMPSAYSSDATRGAAAALAGHLGISYHVLPIETVRAAFEQTLASLFAGTEPDTAEENVQARIRGTLVMAYANKFHAVALATGNRSELAVGYCTLYGDTAGGLAVIGDVPKTAVYELAAHVNRAGEVIPRRIVELAPTAELKPDQTDQDVLPPYDVLDQILQLHLEGRLGPDQIIERGFDDATVSDVLARVKRADFKRRQTPPALQVWSPGNVWPRYPLAGRLARRDEES